MNIAQFSVKNPVLVNLMMIDFMNRRRAGKDTTVFQYWRSIINGGRLRLRPIILTSLTTISGLIPMAFGIGGISEMWSPLANVILFGLLVASILTLFVIPSLIAVVDDLKRSRKKATAMGLGIRTNGKLAKVRKEGVVV